MVRGPRRHRVDGPPPAESWPQLDELDLKNFFALRIPTLRSCPNFLRGRWRFALRFALDARRTARGENNAEAEVRAWKLFAALPALLLWRPRGRGSVGRAVLEQRFDDFASGNWTELLQDARASAVQDGSRPPGRDKVEATVLHEAGLCPCSARIPGPSRRGQAAFACVQLGDVSRGRQCLAGAALAPGTDDTLQQLQSKRPREVLTPLPLNSSQLCHRCLTGSHL